MWPILLILARDHLRHRPFRVCLTIAGIAIGVAAWLAIRTANVEVYRSFERSVDAVVGQATVIISGGETGFDERLLEDLQRHPEVQSAHPLLRIRGKVHDSTQPGRRIPIYGLDVLEQVETLFPPSSSDSSRLASGEWEHVFSPQTIFLGLDLAKELGVKTGDRLVIEVNKKPVELWVRGMVDPPEGRGRQWKSYAVMDIAAAQWIFGLPGVIHEIHIVSSPGISRDRLVLSLQKVVPTSLRVHFSDSRSGHVEGMLKAFQMNLSMLSGIALLVGLFLVYNSMAFSVAQHRKEIGILRSLGFSRMTLTHLFLLEAGVLGLIGGMGGCWLGMGLADLLMGLVGQSVGELYGVNSSLAGSLSIPRILEGIGMGIAVSLAGALQPSFEAGRMAPVQALSLSPDFRVSRNQGSWAFPLLVSTLLGSLILSVFPAVDGIPWGGYASALCLLVGGTVVGPLLFRLMTRSKNVKGDTKDLGLWPSLAAEQMTRHIGRTSVTLSAIVVGLSILVGVGLMIQSFRHTVELWIEQTMVADLIVAPMFWLDEGEQRQGLPLSLQQVLQDLPGVEDVDPYREARSELHGQDVAVVARDLGLHSARSRYLFQEGDSTEILKKTIGSQGVLVSEVMAQRFHLMNGRTLELSTPKGGKSFPIEGIFYDYATDGGKIVMDESLYRRYWPDTQATVFAIYLTEEIPQESLRRSIQEALAGKAPVTVLSNKELRSEILDIFDRTFRVTYVLELIALTVAALGIVNTLMTAIMERRRELATLRALGASTGQVKRLIYWEAGFLGMWGAGIGMAVGVVLSLLLIKVINKQSFGWTIQWNVSPEPLVMGLLVAAAAVLAGAWWPARWAARHGIAEGLRYE